VSAAPATQELTSQPEPRTEVRTRRQDTAVQELVEQGWTIAAISSTLA
jgi:hypothetical protein